MHLLRWSLVCCSVRLIVSEMSGLCRHLHWSPLQHPKWRGGPLLCNRHQRDQTRAVGVNELHIIAYIPYISISTQMSLLCCTERNDQPLLVSVPNVTVSAVEALRVPALASAWVSSCIWTCQCTQFTAVDCISSIHHVFTLHITRHWSCLVLRRQWRSIHENASQS